MAVSGRIEGSGLLGKSAKNLKIQEKLNISEISGLIHFPLRLL